MSLTPIAEFVNTAIYLRKDPPWHLSRSPQMDFLRALPGLGPQPQGPWLAGGAARKLYFNQDWDTDLDFVFTSQEALDYWLKELANCDVSLNGDKQHVVEFNFRGRPIQLIRHKFFPTPQAALDDFDFTICQFLFDGIHFYHNSWSVTDTHEKRLRLANGTRPIEAIMRVAKYGAQGFKCGESTARELCRMVAKDPALAEAELVVKSNLELEPRA